MPSNHNSIAPLRRRSAWSASRMMLGVLLVVAPVLAQDDPRNPDMCELPLLGTMRGYLEKDPLITNTEYFGMDIDAIVEPDGRTS